MIWHGRHFTLYNDRTDKYGWGCLPILLFIALVALGILFGAVMLTSRAHARDPDGRFVGSPLKSWFDKLTSGKGPCCSDADGNVVVDADWETKDGHYRVRIKGDWHDVPDDAVVTVPNLFGRTMVWPLGGEGWRPLTIRCFMPGSMT